jgi:deazaflavin-dependent oxidoreductase (nitroreductase family)
MDDFPAYRRPGPLDRLRDRLQTFLIERALCACDRFLLEVPGRRTGLPRRTPVNVFIVDGQHYLVAPRGETHWVRNVRASGRVSLRRGRHVEQWDALEVLTSDKPLILHGYLNHFGLAVQRHFLIDCGEEESMLWASACLHPTFHLLPVPMRFRGPAPTARAARTG